MGSAFQYQIRMYELNKFKMYLFINVNFEEKKNLTVTDEGQSGLF